MTYKRYAEIVDHALKNKKEIFVNQWLTLETSDEIMGFDPCDLDHNKSILEDFYDLIHRPFAEVRKISGMSQNELANRFSIPVRTLQNWEIGVREMPVHEKLLLMEVLGQYDPAHFFNLL